MSEENKAIARREWEEIWNQGNLDVIDEICAPNYVGHFLPPGMPSGREGYKQLVTMYRAAFPDIQITIEDQIAQGDKVVTRWTSTGTHKGELMGVAATGNFGSITGISINRIVGGLIVEDWTEYDGVRMLQNIGALPSPGG